MSWVVNPLVPRGTRKPRMPSSGRAHTTATSAADPLVIHILEPCRIQSSPSRLARVRIAAGSEPASGSVSPKQPSASPAAIRGQPLELLLLRPPTVNRVHGQRPLHRDQAAQPAVAGLELQAREPV